MLFLLFVLNFGISWFNAWSVGRSWVETKAAGGWLHFMSWMGAIMSACGFTWCYLVVLGMAATSFNWLPPTYLKGFFSLGYLVIIIPVLGSGLAIMIQSWAHFWREKNILNGGVAAWNTFGQVYNTYQAVKNIPTALEGVMGMFKDVGDGEDDVKSKLLFMAIFLVIVAVVGGVLTTTAIIRSTARSSAQRVLAQV